MIFKALQSNMDVEDSLFNDLYPSHIKDLADRHWTPVAVAKLAAEYLVQDGKTKVLDIGAGVGKFCLVGASCTDGMFYGIEQRESLIKLSTDIAEKYDIQNVEFMHGNISEVNFADYDAFYFYNSFYENIDTSCPIDDLIPIDRKLFRIYTRYMKNELDQLPIGTRLATYWGGWNEVPGSFEQDGSACNGLLNFWKKTV
ncbi:methyltransferase domain-containing protein [Sphingobacterium faecale]|uniref:Methyltransferase domain-containing protein n=1 Tax=Sphingobacterium faecale TaxID=2803775 RepID=A0ABS1R416_9SPHI|nr:methyltransferase domain-containing protein [Sphingobacterium faecale]MBL1409456.1 methyltransferase domain-containing protein [Sphingobacterium faecale]